MHARGDPRRVAAGGDARLPVLRARRPADARGAGRSPRSAARARSCSACAIAALTVCFLWLERLPLRPGHRRRRAGRDRARRRAAAEHGHRPRRARGSTTARGPKGSARPPRCASTGSTAYGPIRWQREGREMLRIQTRRAQYWKLENLEDFDGQRWVDARRARPVRPRARGRPRAELDREAAVERAARASPSAACAATSTPAPARRSRSTPAPRRRSRPSRPAPGRPTASSRPATPTRSSSTRRARTCSSCRPPAAARAASRATR